MESNTVLFLGGGELQLPHVRTAQKLGLYTAVCDKSPVAACKETANEFHNISATEVDKILSIANQLNKIHPLLVVVPANEYGLTTTAQVNEKFSLNGIRLADIAVLTNKSETKIYLDRASLPTISAQRFITKNMVSIKDFPVVVKPLDGISSRGVMKLNNKDDVLEYYQNYKNKYDTILCEKYVAGKVLSVKGFHWNKKTKVYSVGERFFSDDGQFRPLGGYYSHDLYEEHFKQIQNMVERFLVFCEDSDFHFECDIIYDGLVYNILETTPVLDSGSTTWVIPHLYGFDPFQIYLQLYLGQISSDEIRMVPLQKQASWVCLYSLKKEMQHIFDTILKKFPIYKGCHLNQIEIDGDASRHLNGETIEGLLFGAGDNSFNELSKMKQLICE